MTSVHLNEEHRRVNKSLDRDLREGKISREEHDALYYEEIGTVECGWYAYCFNQATHYRQYPGVGLVPICGRCDDRVNEFETRVD